MKTGWSDAWLARAALSYLPSGMPKRDEYYADDIIGSVCSRLLSTNM